MGDHKSLREAYCGPSCVYVKWEKNSSKFIKLSSRPKIKNRGKKIRFDEQLNVNVKKLLFRISIPPISCTRLLQTTPNNNAEQSKYYQKIFYLIDHNRRRITMRFKEKII